MSWQTVRGLMMGVTSLSCLTLSALTASADEQRSTGPKNIIMVVADGMGPAYTSGYRYYRDKDHTDGISPTIFDEILVGNASTYPASESGVVTDSAAGATALASGVKTYNGAISVDTQRQPVNTVLREAKRLGMRTGIAVTSQIIHATPAAFITHNESRKNYDQIANQFFDDRINGQFVADVMLGGGTDYFERRDRDLIAEFIDAGYQYTDSYNKLATYTPGQKLLGLFADDGLPWALDDKRKHRLSYLTRYAIKHLENDNGYFLLVEASQIDWAGHMNDIASAMAEMDDLAQTMIYLKQYVQDNPDTLVVLTADHSTGGFTLGTDGDYRWEPHWLSNLQSSPQTIASQMTEEAEPISYLTDQLGFALNGEEQKSVTAMLAETDVEKRVVALQTLLDKRTNTGWTTTGHTGIDVPVFAMGNGAFLFAGGMDNTNIANTLFALLEGKPVVDPKAKPAQEKTGAKKEVEKIKQQLCNFKEDWHC